MPKILQGNWRGHSDRLKISNKHVYVIPKNGAAVSRVKSVKYRYLGHRTYKYYQKFTHGGSYSANIKISVNHRTVKVNGHYYRK
ncbi:hypothetical protein [Secundilactobacillus folii]|nr:hypothetical protein [Secundilactobacillus folii]